MAKMIIRNEALARIRHAADILLSDPNLAKLDQGESLQSAHFDTTYGGRVTFSLEASSYDERRPSLVIEDDNASPEGLPHGFDIESTSGSVPMPLKAIEPDGRIVPLHVRSDRARAWRPNTFMFPVDLDRGDIAIRLADAANVTEEQRAIMRAEMGKIIRETAP